LQNESWDILTQHLFHFVTQEFWCDYDEGVSKENTPRKPTRGWQKRRVTRKLKEEEESFMISVQ
jgi:hypothetical protein